MWKQKYEILLGNQCWFLKEIELNGNKEKKLKYKYTKHIYIICFMVYMYHKWHFFININKYVCGCVCQERFGIGVFKNYTYNIIISIYRKKKHIAYN